MTNQNMHFSIAEIPKKNNYSVRKNSRNDLVLLQNWYPVYIIFENCQSLRGHFMIKKVLNMKTGYSNISIYILQNKLVCVLLLDSINVYTNICYKAKYT